MSLSLKTRFFLAALFAACLMAGYSAIILRGNNTMDSLLKENLPRSLSVLHAAVELKHAVVFYDDLIFRYITTSDALLLEESIRAREKANRYISDLKKLEPGPVVTELLDELGRESNAYFNDAQKLISAAPSSAVPSEKESILKMIEWARSVPRQQTALSILSSSGRARLTRLYSLCDRLGDLSRQNIQNVQMQAEKMSRSGRDMAVWAGGAVITGGFGIAVILAISVLAPLRGLLGGIKRIIDGDLSFEIPPKGDDEIGRLTNAFNTMTRKLKEKEDQLVRETITDALTGAYNFKYFQEVLKSEVERAKRYKRPLSVLMLDIDHFKKFNDSHGHEMGNVLLKNLVLILKENIRPSDVFARYGGEEFVVLLPDTDSAQGKGVAERIRAAASGSEFPGQETQPGGVVTVSIGGSTSPIPPISAKDIVQKADKALYQAKNEGRNRVIWEGTHGK